MLACTAQVDGTSVWLLTASVMAYYAVMPLLGPGMLIVGRLLVATFSKALSMLLLLLLEIIPHTEPLARTPVHSSVFAVCACA